jgi:PPK2 family polyphosphate:nucleotide phosphotransferase
MLTHEWRVPPGTAVDLSAVDPGGIGPFTRKKDSNEAAAADLERLRPLQERLHVDGRYAVLLVLQGMDTSGKDGTVRHLSRGLELIGAEVSNFVKPAGAELQHDYLWRVHARAPARGRLGIFNRSHYEDVLVPIVHDVLRPEAALERYRQINDFERMLVQNGTILLKCFLHISHMEQRRRLQARLDNPEKWWKLDLADVEERNHWGAYQAAYEAALSTCSTPEAPWHIVPADHKWFRNYAVCRLLVETLEAMEMRLPEPAFDPAAIRIA